MPASPPFDPGTRIRIVTASGLHFRGAVQETGEDWIAILDEKTNRKVAFSYRAIALMEEVYA